jgi:aminobenzoyl-glutamate transport protein
MPVSHAPERKGSIANLLLLIERVGNLLPHPATLFLIMAVFVVLMSGLLAQFDLKVTNPETKEIVEPVSLMTVEGLHRILTKMVTNFTSFAPLGTVLVALLGIAVAESSGLIGTCMRLLVTSAPRSMLTGVVVFAGVLSNAASEIGYVLLVPLGAMIFQAAGRHPIAGLAAAFAGVSGGYSANLLLGTVDPLLSGLTEEAAHLFDPTVQVNPACNYIFMFVSTFLVTGIGWFVTERIVVPRCGEYKDDGANNAADELRPLTKAEWRGLKFSGVTAIVLVGLVLWGTVPQTGFLRGEDGDLLDSPFLKGIVAMIFFFGGILGVAYGIGARTIRNDTDVMRGMGKSMSTLGEYMVLVFFAAQFVSYFNWTNLGLILAIKGANLLQALNLGGIPLLLALVLLTAAVNLVMGSASAKWAVLAPVFVPMFMLLGFEPAMIQAAYRVGDSCTNIISPMMSYFALIIAFFNRYDKNAGIGTLVATMLPYSVAFLIGWSILLTIWVWFEIPLGFQPAVTGS